MNDKVTRVSRVNLLIDGSWTTGVGTFEVLDKFTNEIIAVAFK